MGATYRLNYDRLVLAVGSVNKLLPIPGVAEHAHGFRGLPEALYLRDHIVRQFEVARPRATPRSAAARSTFVVVGAGYTGTEVAAHGQLLTKPARRPLPVSRPPSLDAARHRRTRCCRSSTSGCPHRRPGAARSAASRSERGPRWRRLHDGVRLTTVRTYPPAR